MSDEEQGQQAGDPAFARHLYRGVAGFYDKIDSRFADRIRPMVSSAEDLSVPHGTFDLVVIGNAFHRLPRESVANLIVDWLEPGGHLALFWSNSPWVGEQDWQPTFRKILAEPCL